MSEGIALYVHIPFCETKCPYCDFNTYSGIETLIPAYVPALVREISFWGATLHNPKVHTVFFGGGTPSYLASNELCKILEQVRASFRVALDAEVTVEANPDDFDEAKLAAYLEAGVNRLSIGVQSLDDDLLLQLGRRHDSVQAMEAYRMARAAGFGNVSIDLMYGLPSQTLDQWVTTLDQATEFEPVHMSMYCLTLEPGTPMEQWVKKGVLKEPDPDVAADMYLAAEEKMDALDYRHYEISNWAKPRFESRHNLAYWRNQPYLGVGPGAHSYLNGMRFANIRSPKEYVRLLGLEQTTGTVNELDETLIRTQPILDTLEVIEPHLEMAETMMMGMRLDTGVSEEEFVKRFGITIEEAYGAEIFELTRDGLIQFSDGTARLTPRGRLLGNRVFSRFFQDKRDMSALLQ